MTDALITNDYTFFFFFNAMVNPEATKTPPINVASKTTDSVCGIWLPWWF